MTDGRDSAEREARVIVDHSQRGKGLGRDLMGAVIAEARSMGVATLALNVIAENDRARSLYSSLGFDDRGGHPDRDDMRVMSMSL